jgi:phosphoribosylformimino-5-aminoimidazole carboxamide ribotide isomerase
MRIIPAIDIIEGKAVRLSQGDYSQKKIYNEDPLEVAKAFEGAGLNYLHLVDLDGAKSGAIVNWKILEKISTFTNLQIDFGGGVKTSESIRIAFECGANQVTGGSVAIVDPPLFESWLKAYGAEKIILGADCREGKIAVQGWTQNSDTQVMDFIGDYVTKGIAYVVCTDISKDGMLQGPAFDLYERIQESTPGLKLIASGGISSIANLEKLRESGLDGAIIGKAIYEGKIALKELVEFKA